MSDQAPVILRCCGEIVDTDEPCPVCPVCGVWLREVDA